MFKFHQCINSISKLNFTTCSRKSELLEFTPPGAGGEVQLTDAIDALMKHEQVDAYYMKGKSHDCGSKLGYMKANVEYALRHPSLGDEFKEYLASVVK